jgi:hypothetical protein
MPGPSVRRAETRLGLLLAFLTMLVIGSTVLAWGATWVALRDLDRSLQQNVEDARLLRVSLRPLEQSLAWAMRPAPDEFGRAARRLDSVATRARETWQRYRSRTNDRRLGSFDELEASFERTFDELYDLVSTLRSYDIGSVQSDSRSYSRAVMRLTAASERLDEERVRRADALRTASRNRARIARTMLMVSAASLGVLILSAVIGSRRAIRRRSRGAGARTVDKRSHARSASSGKTF